MRAYVTDVAQPKPLDQLAREIAAAANCRAILVGGQALGVWVEFFGLTARLSRESTSLDIDFVGHLSDAKKLAEHLNAKLSIAARFSHTPNIAHITASAADGSVVDIDVLKQAFGIDNDALRRHAVTVRQGDKNILIMHPVHVLQSRLANTLRLRGRYASDHGIAQLQAAMLCVNYFIRHRLRENERDACMWARTISNWAHDNSLGHLAWTAHGLDLLLCIPIEAMPRRFREQEWPVLLKRVELRRAKKPIRG